MNPHLQRLERGLQIALERSRRYQPALSANELAALEQANSDIRRLIEAIEAIEREAGVVHVRVRSESLVDRLVELHQANPEEALALARQMERELPGMAEDVAHWPRTGQSADVCPFCSGSGRWDWDIPCGRCEGTGRRA